MEQIDDKCTYKKIQKNTMWKITLSAPEILG